jgi:2-polyprenyl-3-methyl-5-hydroxy-6-metoxy-1,4-benzoquinol methylase
MMMSEAQYAPFKGAKGERLGSMSGHSWKTDPTRVAFVLSRYKFVARMLSGYNKVLEVGCSDGFFSRVVRQSVGELVATDFDEEFINQAKENFCEEWPIDFRSHNIVSAPLPGFDAAFCLDVFEHVREEKRLLQNLKDSAQVVLIGTPSIESQLYASPMSRAGHVNCKSMTELKRVMKEHFSHVFMFGMNDEVLHTGFGPMCHYLFALGVR